MRQRVITMICNEHRHIESLPFKWHISLENMYQNETAYKQTSRYCHIVLSFVASILSHQTSLQPCSKATHRFIFIKGTIVAFQFIILYLFYSKYSMKTNLFSFIRLYVYIIPLSYSIDVLSFPISVMLI